MRGGGGRTIVNSESLMCNRTVDAVYPSVPYKQLIQSRTNPMSAHRARSLDIRYIAILLTVSVSTVVACKIPSIVGTYAEAPRHPWTISARSMTSSYLRLDTSRLQALQRRATLLCSADWAAAN